MTDEATIPEPKNITEAIARIMGELPAIGKKKDPSGGVKYAFRGIEAITAEAQELCAKYGVVFYPRADITEIREIVVNGNPWTDTILSVEYEVVHGPSDTSRLIRVAGIGRDNSDKGSNKAMTQAFKYALIQTFMIADPKDDGDKESHAADSGTSAGSRRERVGTVRRAPGRADVDADTGEIAGSRMQDADERQSAPELREAVAESKGGDYSAFTLQELVAACTAAGIPTTGGKKGMAAALLAHGGSGATSNGSVAVLEREEHVCECGEPASIQDKDSGVWFCDQHAPF